MNRSRILTVLLHISAWVLLMVFPLWVLPRTPLFVRADGPSGPPGGEGHGFALDPTLMQTETLLSIVFLAVFFYINIYVLIPKVLNTYGRLTYAMAILSCLIVYLAGGYWFRIYLFSEYEFFRPPLFVGVPNFLFVLGISVALRWMEDRRHFEQALKEQENEQLKSELAFLRSQISPHFLFNVLNGLASMARKNSDKLEDSIIQLSQLLRYSLYGGMEKVPIEKEVEYIDNYIRLQSLRFGSHAHVGFRKNIEGRGLLEPMLLVPFVENAFKHGIVQVDDPVIDIRIDVKEKQLQFDVKNRFVPGSGEQKDETSGIGLANVRRRLHLLYKDAHELAIEEKEGWFIVSLKILLE